MRGTVDRLNPDEGFGFIIADNGQELFFHRTALEGVDWEAIAPGTALEFDAKAHVTGDEPGEHPRAVSVRLAPDAVPAEDHEALPAEKTR
jgi:cold shock CspA family protein